MPIPGDPSSYGLEEYVINPGTGETVRMPSAFGQYMGLPRATPALPAYDPNEAGPYEAPAPRLPAAPAPPDDDAQLEQWLAQKRGEYERFGASPEKIKEWDDFNRTKYSKFLADRRAAEEARLVASVAPQQSGVAHIAQATGPAGTIDQIGEELPLDTQQRPRAQPQFATQAELDAALAAQVPPAPSAPYDPNRPEEAGADLQRQGLALQEQSAQQTAAADQQAATAEEREIEERNKRLGEERKRAAQEEQRWLQRRKEIEGDVAKKTDEWAAYKVDPGRRWKNTSTAQKIGAAISVAMTALGDSLQRKSGKNLALEIITKSIEDDIGLQVNERQHLGEIASRSRTSLDDYRRNYGDWQQARAAKLAEEYKRTADEIERIAAGQKSERARANSIAMVGELRSRAGALENGIATSAWNREMKLAEFAEQKRHARQSEALGWAGHRQQANQFAETMQFKRDELAANQKADVDKYLAKASADERKMLIENGIRDPVTRQYIMGDDGKPILDRNATEAGKTQELLANGQTVLSTIDDIKAKIVNDPGFAKLNPTQKQAALSTAMSGLALQIKEAYTLGTLDKGSVEFLDKFTGGDPTKITAGGLFGAIGIGADAGDKVSAKLDEIAKGVERKALNRLGNPKGFKFTRLEPAKPSPANKAAESVQRSNSTGASAVEAEEPGALSKGLQDLESLVFGTEQTYKKRQRAADETGRSVKYPSFRAEKEKDLDVLVSAAKSGDEQARQRIVEMAGNQQVKGLSDATMTLLEAELPDLIPQALAAMPEEKRAYRQAIYAARSRGPQINVHPGAGVPLPGTERKPGSILTPEQEEMIARTPAAYRGAMRAALERQMLRGQ